MINWLMNTETVNSILYGSSSGVAFNKYTRGQVICAFAVGIIMSFGTLVICG